MRLIVRLLFSVEDVDAPVHSKENGGQIVVWECRSYSTGVYMRILCNPTPGNFFVLLSVFCR